MSPAVHMQSNHALYFNCIDIKPLLERTVSACSASLFLFADMAGTGLNILPSLDEIQLAQKILDKAGDKGKKAKMASMVCWLKVMVVQIHTQGPGRNPVGPVLVYIC